MTDASRLRRTLTGRLTVSLPPARAFHLFTARGEQSWAEDWMPVFPVPTTDDSTTGTVFQTVNHAHPTTWIVVASEPGHLIQYAQVTPDLKAAVITVNLSERAAGDSEVTVVYDLTSLSPAGDRHLDDFAAGYSNFIRTWQDAIGQHLAEA